MSEPVVSCSAPQAPTIDYQKLRELVENAQGIVRSLDFAQSVAQAETLDDAFLLLTNDIRVLLPFDRSFLITHFGGKSKFIAAGGIVAPEKKSRFYKEVGFLTKSLKSLDQPLFVSADKTKDLAEFGISEDIQRGIDRFVSFSGAGYFLCIPLKKADSPVCHLIFEFIDGDPPDRNSLANVRQIEPFLASALVEKWVEETKPEFLSLVVPESPSIEMLRKRKLRNTALALGGLIAALVLLFLVPIPYVVGGEAEVVPMERNFAFSRTEGIIEKIFVREGSVVEAGQVVAVLDSKEIDYKIGILRRELESLGREVTILTDGAGNNPAKLAKAELVDLNRKKKQRELDYYQSQKQFLEITTPVSGTVLTKNIESLAGKRLAAGEPLCELAAQNALGVDIFVPDDRVTRLKPGQEVRVYFNSEPSKAHLLKLRDAAPKAEALPRLGNIYRSRAEFMDGSSGAMSGMKGIGKINTGDVSLYKLLADRFGVRWNAISISFF